MGDYEEVCVEEVKACAADKTCSMLHEKLQAAMKKEGGYGGKDGEGKGEGKGDYGVKDGEGKGEGKGDYGGKDGEGKGKGEGKGDYGGKDGEGKGDYGGKGEYGKYDQKKEVGKKPDHRQLQKKEYEKKDGEDGKKGGDGKKDDGKKDGYGEKKDVEPSAELKAAMKACTENELCKKLMECKKKHMESGGKGDGEGKGEGKGDYEEVCVEEVKAC